MFSAPELDRDLHVALLDHTPGVAGPLKQDLDQLTRDVMEVFVLGAKQNSQIRQRTGMMSTGKRHQRFTSVFRDPDVLRPQKPGENMFKLSWAEDGGEAEELRVKLSRLIVHGKDEVLYPQRRINNISAPQYIGFSSFNRQVASR